MKLTKKEKEYVLNGRRRIKVHTNSKRITNCRKNSNLSRGENKISDFLVHNSVSFSREWYFSGCYSKKSNHLLYFDFFLHDYNLCIEYDGEQHFRLDKSEKEKINDFTKTAYCHKNGIHLLRIKYTDFENIETIICRKIDQIESL